MLCGRVPLRDRISSSMRARHNAWHAFGCLVLHASIYFLRPEQLLEVRKRRTHPPTNRIGIFALKRQTSAKKASMRSSIESPR